MLDYITTRKCSEWNAIVFTLFTLFTLVVGALFGWRTEERTKPHTQKNAVSCVLFECTAVRF